MAMAISNSIYSFVVAIVVDCVFILVSFLFSSFYSCLSARAPIVIICLKLVESTYILISINHSKTVAIVCVWIIVVAYISAQTHSISDVHSKTMANF